MNFIKAGSGAFSLNPFVIDIVLIYNGIMLSKIIKILLKIIKISLNVIGVVLTVPVLVFVVYLIYEIAMGKMELVLLALFFLLVLGLLLGMIKPSLII